MNDGAADGPSNGAAGDLPADPGWFGPDSVTWRIHSDTILWVGGVRALFLQALHPLAMAGVAQHSDFNDDPWGRLRRTADYVGTITFGPRADAQRAAARVRERHRGLVGVEPESGKRYAVADPQLLLWVHCCEVDSFLTAALRSGLGLDEADADRYVEEQVIAGRLIGIPRRLLPTTVEELDAYFADVRPRLAVTAESRRARRFLLLPPMPIRVRLLTPAVPAWTTLVVLSFATLPEWARRMYGEPGLPAVGPAVDLAATAGTWALGKALRAVPEHLRRGPHYKAALERLAIAG